MVARRDKEVTVCNLMEFVLACLPLLPTTTYLLVFPNGINKLQTIVHTIVPQHVHVQH
jgi:hypothetical protein